MHYLKSVLLFLVFLVPLAISLPTTHFVLSSYLIPSKDLKMELDVTTPKVPGAYPVMLFLTGVEGLAPSSMQSELFN